MNYVDLMEGAGLGDVLRPQEEFMKEHERLVGLLSDKKEGGSGKSNFIARLMAEQKYKHRDPSEKNKPYEQTTTGQYRKPVMDPEVDDTKMSQAIKFDYNKIANKNQVRSGTNPEAYGASPFIAYHFGHATIPRKPRETAAQTAARRKFSGRDDAEPAERSAASAKRKARRDKQTAPSVPKSMAEIIRDKKAKAARTAESEPKGFLSSSDKEPQSRPARISKQNWLDYLNSKTYQDLLEQRQFEIDSRRR